MTDFLLSLLKWFLITPALFCIVGTVCSFIKYEAWWVRGFDFPRIQMLVLILFSACLVYFFNEYPIVRYVLWASLFIALCFHCWVIFPYSPIASKNVKNAENVTEKTLKVSILVSNVLMYNRETNKLKVLIERENPDIVFMVETDHWWADQMEYLKKEYPYHLLKPIDNTYGLLFYSKKEPTKLNFNYYVQDDVPSIVATFKLDKNSEETFDFYGIHPRPPAPKEAKTSIPRDAELVMVGKEIEKKDNPTIVAGDFNDVAWSHTSRLFRRLGNLLDPRIGRGMYSTFHADYAILRWPLDHVFHSDEFQIIEIKKLEHVGSDHFPIFINLAYIPQEKHTQEEPEVEKDDEEEAKKKLEKAHLDDTSSL
ncbi:endonuclease/exonuclease/phosphatase family protein [Bernardetia sp. Wsw4-3y2]|uniref:endonuclease/exonuclease/phosphatase family protein n=1 Tax=Bernardetia sp. Wsw4-3y2 TaxID=3127471 RepID=UPI0030CD7561